LTRHDLQTLLSKLDEFVEEEVIKAVLSRDHRVIEGDALQKDIKSIPYRTFLGLVSVDRGSIELSLLASPDVLHNILLSTVAVMGLNKAQRQLLDGLKKSKLPHELKATGKLTGDALARVVTRFNLWIADKFTPQHGPITAKAGAVPEQQTPKSGKQAALSRAARQRKARIAKRG